MNVGGSSDRICVGRRGRTLRLGTIIPIRTGRKDLAACRARRRTSPCRRAVGPAARPTAAGRVLEPSPAGVPAGWPGDRLPWSRATAPFGSRPLGSSSIDRGPPPGGNPGPRPGRSMPPGPPGPGPDHRVRVRGRPGRPGRASAARGLRCNPSSRSRSRRAAWCRRPVRPAAPGRSSSLRPAPAGP